MISVWLEGETISTILYLRHILELWLRYVALVAKSFDWYLLVVDHDDVPM